MQGFPAAHAHPMLLCPGGLIVCVAEALPSHADRGDRAEKSTLFFVLPSIRDGSKAGVSLIFMMNVLNHVSRLVTEREEKRKERRVCCWRMEDGTFPRVMVDHCPS